MFFLRLTIEFFLKKFKMKILIIFALAIFSLSSADFVEKIEPHIVGGTESQWGQFASSVIIDGPNEFCGGTIVDRRHVSKIIHFLSFY